MESRVGARIGRLPTRNLEVSRFDRVLASMYDAGVERAISLQFQRTTISSVPEDPWRAAISFEGVCGIRGVAGLRLTCGERSLFLEEPGDSFRPALDVQLVKDVGEIVLDGLVA